MINPIAVNGSGSLPNIDVFKFLKFYQLIDIFTPAIFGNMLSTGLTLPHQQYSVICCPVESCLKGKGFFKKIKFLKKCVISWKVVFVNKYLISSIREPLYLHKY